MKITKGFPDHYTAVQMHLHWGGWDLEASGSEHTVDGIRYMAEVFTSFILAQHMNEYTFRDTLDIKIDKAMLLRDCFLQWCYWAEGLSIHVMLDMCLKSYYSMSGSILDKYVVIIVLLQIVLIYKQHSCV